MVVHQPHEQADDTDHERELVAEGVQLLLERRVVLLLGGGLNLRLDLADLGAHPGVQHRGDARALRHGGAAEEHALLALELASGVGDRFGRLVHRDGLSGERRLFETDRRGFQSNHSAIRRDAIAGSDLDDVPGDELARGEVADPLAGAEASRGLALHLLERLERALRVALLPHADDGVEHEDEQDDAGFDEVHQGQLDARRALLGEREHERHERRDEEDLHEGVVELLEHELPQGLTLLLVQLVEPVLGSKLGDLCFVEARFRVDAELGADFGGGRGPRRVPAIAGGLLLRRGLAGRHGSEWRAPREAK